MQEHFPAGAYARTIPKSEELLLAIALYDYAERQGQFRDRAKARTEASRSQVPANGCAIVHKCKLPTSPRVRRLKQENAG